MSSRSKSYSLILLLLSDNVRSETIFWNGYDYFPFRLGRVCILIDFTYKVDLSISDVSLLIL